jgi:hypothetical protein
MYTGSCLCGAIQFKIEGEITDIVHCHCSLCRKAQGSAFATNGNVNTDNFSIISGQTKLTAYESTPGQSKYFCKVCGSPIMSKTDSKPDQVRLRLGTVTSDIIERPIAHIFTTSKANWDDIRGDLPQYEEYEPGRE